MRGSGGIWRALAAARRAELAEAGVPLPPVVAPGITRRRLIAGLGAAATIPFWPRPALARDGGKIAIIGGGMAGLVALDRLRAAGLDATLYEARAACGGRMRSAAMGRDLVVDEGGQLVNSDHDLVKALCARFGLTLVDRQTGASQDLLIGATGNIARQLRPLATRIARDARRVDNDPRYSARIDALSAAAYLDRIGARGDARRWLEQTMRTEYGAEPEAASALELVWNLPVVDGTDIEVLSASDERYVVAGGSARITDALAKLHRDRIRTRAIVDRIGDANGRIVLNFRDGDRVEADRVIVAVPAGTYRGIAFDVTLPPVWRDFIDTVELGRVEKLVVGCDARPWQKAFGPAGAVWGGPGFAEGWDATAGQPEIVGGSFAFLPGGAQVEAFGAESMQALSDRWSAAAEPLLPGLGAARNGLLRRTDWLGDPFARGAYVNFRPGQLTRFAPLLWTEVGTGGQAGALLFAGEHMSDAFPGYMNGAAETGQRAAEAVIAELRPR
jgi:monoamine oxidase